MLDYRKKVGDMRDEMTMGRDFTLAKLSLEAGFWGHSLAHFWVVRLGGITVARFFRRSKPGKSQMVSGLETGRLKGIHNKVHLNGFTLRAGGRSGTSHSILYPNDRGRLAIFS